MHAVTAMEEPAGAPEGARRMERSRWPTIVLAVLGGFCGGSLVCGGLSGWWWWRQIEPTLDPRGFGPLIGIWLFVIAGMVVPMIALAGGLIGAAGCGWSCGKSGKLPVFSVLGLAGTFIAAVLLAVAVAVSATTALEEEAPPPLAPLEAPVWKSSPDR